MSLPTTKQTEKSLSPGCDLYCFFSPQSSFGGLASIFGILESRRPFTLLALTDLEIEVYSGLPKICVSS